MKYYISLILLFFVGVSAAWADVTLPSRCEAFLPAVFYSHSVIYKADADAIANSKDYGQSKAPSGSKRYWVVYSDREHNLTYNGPSLSSGIYRRLGFNDQVRIAKIQNGFALVFHEPVIQSQYPNISADADPLGWIPMSHLLLWTSAPADDKGIYDKALIAANIDEKGTLHHTGRLYVNPELMSGEGRVATGSEIYYIMKHSDNDMVLLASQYTLEGTSSEVLYGWVSASSYIHWNQRSCLEPTWNKTDVEYFRGDSVMIYGDATMTKTANRFHYGKVQNPDENNPKSSTLYRIPRQALRYPILDNDLQDTSVYMCTAFTHLNANLEDVIEMQKKALIEKQAILDKTKRLNLIIVIDGTKSMEPFYKPVSEAIRKGAEFMMSDAIYRVGVVIYRDYADGAYLTEYLPMRPYKDPALRDFLETGGKYGIKSSPSDKTKEEALYQGLAAALDFEKMDYQPDESNLMVVVGDCGNDENDQRIKPVDLVKKMVDSKMNLITFQVCNQDIDAYQSFNLQMEDLLLENANQQYQKIGLEFEGQRVAFGYDQKTIVNKDRVNNADYFVFSTRQANEGNTMDPNTLAGLIRDCLKDYAATIQKRIDIIVDNGNIFAFGKSLDPQMASADSAYFIESVGYELYEELKKTGTLTAFTGYTPKRDRNGRNYWKSILYISADEFINMMQRLAPVNTVAQEGANDRIAYVNAIKTLLRSLIPDITEEEMDRKRPSEIMALIAGLNESTAVLKGPSLVDIMDPKVVSNSDYKTMVNEFAKKYRDLDNVRKFEYRYSMEFNGAKWYWIPIEDLP